jgi:hypothetical protein
MIKELRDTDTTVLTYEITGKITLDEEKEWIEHFNTYLQTGEKLRILLIFGENAGWSISAAFEDLKWLCRHYSKIEKIAIVSDSMLWKWYVKLNFVGKIFGTKECYFSSRETAKALTWVSF